MSTPHQQARHSVRHVRFFPWLADSKDHFKNDFLFLGMTLVTKSILGPKWELTQNIGTKSAFSPIFLSVSSTYVSFSFSPPPKFVPKLVLFFLLL